MVFISGLLAALAVGGAVGPSSEPAVVDYQIRDLEYEGHDWRTVLSEPGQRLDWQDGVSIWLIDDKSLSELLTWAQGNRHANVVACPRIRALAGTRAAVQVGMERRNFVVGVERLADGPRGEATRVAFQPIVETVEEGVVVGVSALPGNDRHELAIEIVERRVDEVRTGRVEDSVIGDPEQGSKETSVAASVQVPVVRKSEARGTWDVPRGKHLVVGLGPRGKEVAGRIRPRQVVMERLVVITPSAGQDPNEAIGQPNQPLR